MTISGIGGIYNSREVAQSCINRYSDTDTNNVGKADSDNGKKIDLTNMTGKEVLEWVNTSILNGEMPFEESGVFIPWFNRTDRFNLLEEVQDAATGARDLKFDAKVIKRFEWATQYVRDFLEKQLFSIDVQA
jgi:hypothetical protein